MISDTLELALDFWLESPLCFKKFLHSLSSSSGVNRFYSLFLALSIRGMLVLAGGGGGASASASVSLKLDSLSLKLTMLG
jgi:hypothetical protein